MSNKMIIDASHPEETRVVVLRGNRVEEFDFESANKKPLRGNIYLAKVTRVEPSLQAAFVEYGGNRHGFLAFSEIHPDYYQIPVADRQALLDEEARSHREDEDEPNGERRSRRRRPRAQEAARNGDERVSSAAPEEEPATDGERAEHVEGDETPYVAPEEDSIPAEVAAEASAAPAGVSGENTEDGFASVNSDEPSDEMAPRVELGETPLDDG
jgi:ribonuclease E